MSLYFGRIVYHQDVYQGQEPLEVVGLRRKQVELQGDLTGGVKQTGWFSIDGLVSKVCEQQAKPGGCQLHNLYCQAPKCSDYK